MDQTSSKNPSDRVLEQPDDGIRTVTRLAIGFALALVGAVVAALLLT